MQKKLLLGAIVNALESKLEVAVAAAQQAHDTATHRENIAENKYDTLGLEAAYLAHGQSNRIAQYQADLNAFKTLDVVLFSEDMPIALGAWVHLRSEHGQQRYFFIGPNSGGLYVTFQAHEVFVITPSAPLGQTLIGREVGDEVVLQDTHYEVLAIA